MFKFEKAVRGKTWEHEYEFVKRDTEWWESQGFDRVPIFKLPQDEGKPYDKVEAFQIRRIVGLRLLRFVAVLPWNEDGGEYLVVPFSPYSHPAWNDELKSVNPKGWRRVLQLWNARTMSEKELTGFAISKLDPQDAENVRIGLRHIWLGEVGEKFEKVKNLFGKYPKTEKGQKLLQQYLQEEIKLFDDQVLEVL